MTGEDYTEKRAHERKSVLCGVKIIAGDKSFEASIENISAGGARLKSPEAPETGARITLSIDKFGDFEADVLRRNGGGFAVKFTADPETMQELIYGLAVYGQQ